MIQHPAIIALLSSAVIINLLLLFASFYGLKILAYWNITSGSELQLQLERRTYLISTILGYSLVFQLLSLFLLIFTADSLHSLFTGAMCAAGSLGANRFGYPLLALKTGNALLAGVWLLINRLDSLGYDYPLIRSKYRLLLALALLVSIETVLQFRYFLGLKADLITSCCGSLFSSAGRSIGSDLAGLQPKMMMILLASAFILMAAAFLAGIIRNRGWMPFAAAGQLFFITSVAALISFISVYFYELPTHHCPFCILQREYWHIGYLLYACLLGGAISAGGAGAAELFRNRGSLKIVIPGFQRKAAIISMLLYSLFLAISLLRIFTTSFVL